MLFLYLSQTTGICLWNGEEGWWGSQQSENLWCSGLVPFPAKTNSPQHGIPYHAMAWVCLNVSPKVHVFEVQSSVKLNGGQSVHGSTILGFPDASLTEWMSYSKAWIPLQLHVLPWCHSSWCNSKGTLTRGWANRNTGHWTFSLQNDELNKALVFIHSPDLGILW